MALQKPNSRRLLNKDEEDERKASEKFFLPTLEELTAIEKKAKEDAAAAVSSQMADPMRNRNDLGRVAMQSAKREMLAEHEAAVNEQKQKAEAAKAEYERLRFAPSSQVVPGLPSAKQTARETMLAEQSKYDKMRMTEPEYEKTHKANIGETAEIVTNSLAAGAIKSGGTFVDIASATGAGLKSVGKWLGGAGYDDSSMYKEFRKGFQERLVDGDSLYDEFDQYYQEMRKKQDEQFGTLNTFTGYIERAAHSFGEQALMFWTASMSSALFGGTKAFTAISSKADDLAKSGKKGMQMLGQALGKINAGSVGGAASMLVTSSAQSTKEAILDMRHQNEEAAAYGMPKKYTDDEIMEKSALYGFLNGVSEVGLEYAIGGITGAAGSIMPKGKVKNPFLTAVLSYLKGSAGEGFEESVQTLASTGLKRAVYDPTAEVDWREVLDSGIVGMLTGVGMGAPSFIRNTSVGVSAMRDVTSTAKATKRVNTDAQAGVVASVSAAKAKAYGQMAEQVRNTDSENADTIASIYEWAAGRQQEIADAMADDTKRKKIVDENTKDTRAAIQRMRDTNPDFAETERTGLASGANVDDIRMAGELSSVLGKKVRFFREEAKNGTINNGEYHEDTGEIWINTRSKNVKAQIVAHELTHSIEKKDGYQQLVDLTMNKLEAEQKAKGKTLDDLYREKETLYADGGVRLASYDEITSELVAEFVEKRLLTDEASIKSLVSENRTLGQRIREWFDSLLAKMGNASAKEREYIRQMRDMYARALGENVSAETSADGKVRHSFVGESANVDKSQLAVAKQMESDGKTSEEIYAETGWYKQSDGKWRMEIMDEIAVPGNFARDGHDTKKSEKEIRDFAEAARIEAEAKALYESGEFTQEMYDSSMRYAASFREDHQNKGKLTKYLNAPKLFSAYPALENVTLEFRELPDQVLGWSFSELNEIFIDDKQIEKYGQSLEEVLAHEIQHFIQDMEGFEQGTNPEAAGSEEDYYNAGGEIEARDVMDRLRMSKEERRGKMPVRFSISASEIDGSPIDAERISSEEGDVRYKDAVDRGDMETAQRMVNEAAEAKGWIPVTRYHQTGTQFTKFSNENPDAGLNDSDTPNGFFFKENDHDIGVGGDYVKTGHGGNVQMPVFLKMENVLSFKNRDDARSWYTKNVPGYMELLKKYEEYQAEYKRLDNENTGKMFEELERLDESGEYTASKADAVMKKYDAVIDDWIEKTKDYETGLRSEMRKLLNDFFLNGNSEYDAIELEDDGHRYIDGKREDVHTYIVFKNTQIKSSKPVTYDDNGNVIPLSERFKRDNDDIRHSVSREDASVTEAETDQTLQQIRNDIAADEARYRELSDTVMSNERFNALMPDEQNAILDEMQSLRERIDRANQIMQDMSIEQDMGDEVPVPGDESDPLAGVSSAVETEVEELDIGSADYDGYKMSVPEVNEIPKSESNGATAKEQEAGTKKQFTREDAMERYEARKKKREERKTVAKAETAFKRLGYDIDGAIVDNYEDAQGIIEDNRLAAQAGYDVERYIEANNITPIVDTAAKMIATDAVKPTEAETGVSGQQLELAKELAELYKQRQEIMQNNIREQGKKNTNIVNDRLDQILGGYDWYSTPKKSRKFWRQQLQLSLSNPEQVIRDVFGEGAVADELNDYIIKPTVENSARARRQTNQMVSGLRDLGLNESESAVTQMFSEYSNLEESGSKKVAMSQSDLRAVLMGGLRADEVASKIEQQEYQERNAKDAKEFHDSIVEQFENTIKVNQSRARQRALREYKEQGGTNASWNALSEDERKAKIDAAYKAVTDESIERIVNGTKELRKLLDDMYEAINQISVIHGAEPIQFRKGYMPHSHNQTEQLQKWFNDHMGGLNVTPVQDLPTDIAGKTADRKPNKRWFSHAQERTGPRTTWDALGNIEDYLRIANDTIYHMDDIRKMRVLERYIRGIYSVARGATGEEQRARVRNDVMQRMHGTDDDLVFLGLKKPEKKLVSDEDMDLSQMTTFVTWLTNYTNDLAAKQIFNRDIESFAGRKVNNLANTLTSWSSRTMMQYNISSNLKQLSQLGTVSGDVGARISKDAAEMTLRSMQNLGNGTNELEQKYHISERSTFLAEKEAIEEATFASDKDLTAKQKSQQQHAKDIWDYAWSFTDTTMSRYAVYAYFMEGMNRGMDDTAALHYADTKARNILASRMKGSSPLIFQSKNPILRMFTLFQREPLAAWQDILKTMPREYSEMKTVQGEKTAKEQIAKRITGRLLGAGIVNTVYATVLGLGTPAMFDIFGEPLRALFDKLWKDITPDEEDDITFKEMAERYISTLGDEIADDIPFANVVSLISNTYAGTEFESRLALNAPDLRKVFEFIGLIGKGVWNGAQLLWSDDAKDIELLEELSSVKGQIPVSFLDMVMEIVGTAAPAGNQIRKSAKGLIAVLRSGEYTKDGKLKYEVGGVGDSIRAVLLGSSGTRAGQEWIASGFDSLSKTETEAYKALIGAGVSEKRARQYVERVAEAEKVADETQAQAEARMIDRMTGLNKQQKAELYYDMVATDNQRAAVDAAVGAGAKIDDAVETARAIRDSSKKLDRLTALQASDMDTDAREEMYLAMVATKVKDADGNVIGTEDDDTLEALYTTGLDFDDFLDAKQMQSVLNANESLTANQRASRFLAWTASQGYTDAQADVIGENFGFSSGFRVKSETYQKIVDSGVTAENAVKVTDAIAGKTKTADKISAVWSTGLSGNQLDLAVKSVLSEKAYERYRIVVDANIPLEIYTWALLNADQDEEGEKGHGSVNNTERELILSQLALPRKDLSALWLALGGSEKSNPYSGTPKVSVPKVEVPKIEMPKIELPKIGG